MTFCLSVKASYAERESARPAENMKPLTENEKAKKGAIKLKDELKHNVKLMA